MEGIAERGADDGAAALHGTIAVVMCPNPKSYKRLSIYVARLRCRNHMMLAETQDHRI